MREKITARFIVIVLLIVLIGAISVTMGGEKYTDPETYSKSIEILNEKRNNVIAMTGAAAGVSTGLSALPNDIASPIANELANLSTTFMMVLGAIYLEKYLLTLTGMVTFQLLIPVACILLIMFLWTNRQELLRLAGKLVLFGLCIVMLIPTSTYVISVVEDTQEYAAVQSINEVNEFADDLQEKANEEESTVKKWLSKVSGGVKGIIAKAETILGNFIDAAALMVITSCVVPVLVLALFLWLIRIILGINLDVPTEKIIAFARSGHKARNKIIKPKNKALKKNDNKLT